MTIDATKQDFDLLVETGAIGFYQRCEITTIYLHERNTKKNINIFTLCVLEEMLPGKTMHLIPKLVQIDKNYSVGIVRHYETINSIREKFLALCDSGTWEHDGHRLQLNPLQAIGKVYVPATDRIPINAILKNNFSNGSHILEFFDIQKAQTNLIYGDLGALSKLNSIVQSHVPIDLKYIRDRIGNILFQFPITILSVKEKSLTSWDGIQIELGWHPLLATRPKCTVGVTTEFDGLITGHVQHELESDGGAEIRNGDSKSAVSVMVFRTDKQLILSTYKGTFINNFQITSRIGIAHAEPRTIQLPSPHSETPEEIHHVHTYVTEGANSGAHKESHDSLIRDRIYEEETIRLEADLSFKQYGTNNKNDHAEALQDIRTLIDRHAGTSIAIWDPYLTALDLLSTVYFSRTQNILIRAIATFDKSTRAINLPLKIVPLSKIVLDRFESYLEQKHGIGNRYALTRLRQFRRRRRTKDTSYSDWVAEQRGAFLSHSNNLALNLDFRCQHGNYGWKFHDRFLILTSATTPRPMVWSLGSSVNSIGSSHHILLRVTNARNVLDSFDHLWNALDSPECQIWRHP